ncbi:hypothetical protein VagYM19_16040 [Vibrio alginolyticus]|nr:hypothetical protein Vag1382_16030 [Vibrio alginolyticus]BCB47077.1 hypothetical protein VagVIO5_16030 [Vibrio alginolyticus]BCB51678.1 hypothetical protein VagYM19_16040 [Vibrio alginolyticus]BCB56281.1 hypothetical protein VagYM4_16040 [Vibrio alginolyticus]
MAVLQYGTALTLNKISEFSEYQFISAVSKIKPCIKWLLDHSDGLPKKELTFGQKRVSAISNLTFYKLIQVWQKRLSKCPVLLELNLISLYS